MKPIILVFICITGLALGQDKPRVFVKGKGSQNVTTSGSEAGGRYWGSWGSRSSVDSHDEAMEVTKDLQKNCSGVMVTLDQSNTDYTVMLNRESKHNRGLLLTNSQVQVANRLGDVLGANATRTVGNASKDACRLILADWSQHGRIAAPDSPTPAPVATPVVPATPPFPTETARVGTVSAVQPQPTTAAAGPAATVTKTENESSPSVPSRAESKGDSHPAIAAAISTMRDPGIPANSTAGLAEDLIGVWFTGSPTVRHDGIEISGVQPKGPADNIEIKPGDVILAIDGHYLYTIDELRAELLRHESGARMAIRYRHYRLTSENYLTLSSKDAVPHR
jgi:PDZ domain